MKRIFYVLNVPIFLILFYTSTLLGQGNNYTWQRVTLRAPFLERDGAGIVAFNSKLWLLGGWNPFEFKPYGVTSEIWSSIDGYTWTLEGNAPWSARHLHGRVVFNNKMWVISGDNNDGTYKNDVWNSDDGVNWVKVLDDAPWRNRSSPYVVVFNNKIWLMGGQQIQPLGDTVYNDIWNTDDGITWQKVVANAPWAPRSMVHGSAILNNKIWIFGGGDYNEPQKHYNDVWSSSDGIIWDSINASPPWEPRIFVNIASFDNKLWILDGELNHGDRNDVWYSSDGINWTELIGTPWSTRHAASVVVFDSSMWIVAGRLKNDIWRLKTNTLVITSPYGGKIKADTTIAITWKSSLNNTVSLDYSTNSGNTWINITSNIPAVQSNFLWDISLLDSALVLLRIKSDIDPLQYDIVTYEFEKVNLKQGVLSFYPLNSNVLDASANEFNGSAIDILPNVDRFGNNFGAAEFNGVTSLATLPAQTYTPFSGDFTISFWEKANSSLETAPLSIGIDPNNFDIFFNSAGVGLWPFWNSGGSNGMRLYQTSQYTKGDWTHILITRKNDRVLLFIDGEYAFQTVYSNSIARTDNIILGQGSAPSVKWNGFLDELRIFNRSLNDQEISSIYNFTNHQPKLLTLPDTLLTVDSVFFYKLMVADQDTAEMGDIPSVQYLYGPSWIHYDSTNSTISGIPQFQNTGDTVIAFRLRDLFGNDIDKSIALHISAINTLPHFSEISDSIAFEDSLFTSKILAFDRDTLFGDIIRYGLLIKPSWLNIDSLSGVITGIPFSNNVGDTIIMARVNDGHGGADTAIFVITVLHTNHSPIFINWNPDTLTLEDDLYYFQTLASDLDSMQFGDNVRFRLINKPSWLVIDSISGVISGIPRVQNLYDTVVTVQAYDNTGGVASQSYTLHIQHVNHIPEIVSTASFTAKEDSLYRYQVKVEDPDTLVGDVLSYSLTKKPIWLSINSSGLVSGIPLAKNVGDTLVTVRVSDGKGGIASQSYPLTVNHTNHAPVILTEADTTAIEDSIYTYTVRATDQDSALFGDQVRYRFSIKPSWLAIDSIAGIISGIPSGRNAQDTMVAIQAYDNKTGISTQAYALRLQHVNHEPAFISVPVTQATEDSLYEYTATAADADQQFFGDVLKYSFQVKPLWMNIDSVTGLITGIPFGKNVGDTLVTVRVSDGKGGNASQSYPITVSHTNHAPVILTEADTTAIEDSIYAYTVRATDQDSALFGDQVRYRFSVKPNWLTLDSISGLVSGTPWQLNARDTVVTIQVYDNKGGISTQQYILTVQHVNHPPVFVSLPDTTAKEDSLYTYGVKVTDQDSILFGDKVYFALNNAPPFLSIDSVSGAVSGIPTLVDTVFALIKPKTFLPSLRVKGPRVVITKRNESVEAMPLLKVKPAGKFKIAQPASESAGTDEVIRTFTMTIKAYDDKGGVSLQTFDLHVEHTNHPPVFTSLPVSVATEDSFYSYHVSGFDVDTKEFGDSIVIQPVIIPSWMQFDPVSNILSGTPQGKYAVDTTVRLQVEDRKGKSALQEFTLNMINTNHPPAIVSTADSSVAEDSLYIYALTVIDSDVDYGRDSLIVELLSLPSWLTFTGDTVKGIPLYYNVGDTLISLRVIDTKGSVDSMQWFITVTPTYHLPENFSLSSTIPKDTLNIDRSKDLVFTWNPSHDEDVEDTLFYSFRIWGNSLDTTIQNLKDTSLSTQLTKYFTVSTPYRWTVGVTDKRFIVPSYDTIMFVTSDKILNVDDWKSKIPTDFIVFQNYPNPFNPSTTIRFGVPVTSAVLIEIYNIIGQRVTTLTNQEYDARYYEVRWNAAAVSSGVYFAVVRMKPLNEPSGSRHFVKKLLMLK